jgi:hypothetical protein
MASTVVESSACTEAACAEAACAGPQGRNATPSTPSQPISKHALLKFRIIAVGSKIQQALNERLWILCI